MYDDSCDDAIVVSLSICSALWDNIMHTSYLPTGQRSRLKEVSSDINPGGGMITSSSFRALQGQRVWLYLSILRSLVYFRFFKGCFLFVYSHFFFRRFTLSFFF